MSERYNNNLEHLQGALLTLNLALHRQVLRRRAANHAETAVDEPTIIALADHEVDALLDGLYAANAAPDADRLDRAPLATLTALLEDARLRHIEREEAARRSGVTLLLATLAERLKLAEFEQQVVLLALAAELDRRYERLFGYLNDDLNRPRPSVDLAFQLFTRDLAGRTARRRAFAPDAALRAQHIIQLSDESGTLPACGLKLDARIVGFVLGIERIDAALNGILESYRGDFQTALLAAAPAEVAALAKHVRQRLASLVALDGPDQALQIAVAAHIAADTPLLVLNRIPEPADDLIVRAVREARLSGAALAIKAATSDQARRFSELALEQPRFILSATPLNLPAIRLHLPALAKDGRQALWSAALDDTQLDLAELADRFRLNGEQIIAAAHDAQIQAAWCGTPIDRATIFASCRAQSQQALDGLAQPLRSIHTWDDLVLPTAAKAQLRSLEHWVHYRHMVYQEWGFAQRVMLGRGLAVLFSGPSGTGKTMAAGILARNLELDLFRIDLSTVVSKYIGETEKNLSRIFDAAERANAILFFDEADALFGKRSEVKDAHDRYANIEVSYLLQRMEAYDGIAILASNFRQNLDQAFVRRLHVIVEFPLPSAADRDRIWRQFLPKSVPQSDTVDIAYLARQFALSGGNIRNCALTAAFGAAAETSPITMRHLVQAVARELEKTNQPLVRSVFGPYYDLVRAGGEKDDA
ncbi:MAG: ATP-binding protein [Oscillochloris sp.]|nr:ATP-binding protein [Oscillochloris sp.]